MWRLFDVNPPSPVSRWEADVTQPAEEWTAFVIKIHEENRGKEDWQRGSSSGSAGTGSDSPRSTASVAFLKENLKGGKNKQRKLGYTSVESSGRATTFYTLSVLFFFFRGGRHGEITVLYPSLADWSESPPYSALPRPGVEPLENNPQFYACVFHVANTHGP